LRGTRRLGGLLLLGLAGQLALVGGTASAEEASVGAGTGRASAKLVKVGPSRGSLALAPSVGLVLSDFLNTQGRGDVRMLDLGIIADFVPPEVTQQLPTLKVASTDEGAEAGRTTTIGTPAEVPVGASAAELHAAAGPAPFGRSTFALAPLDLGFVRVSGGRTEAFSGVVDGTVREAIGRVEVGRVDIADGAVVLEGLKWEAVHRSGSKNEEQGRFTVGSVTVAGQRFAAPDGAEQPLADALAAAAPVLDPLGVQIGLPRARIEGGGVEMTPLRITFADSELGRLAGPVLEGIQPGREALVDGIRAASEDADIAILLTDVALGLVAGGSSLDVEIGGATAQTAESAARFSFGSGSGGFDLSAGGAASIGTGGARPPASFGSSSSPVPALGKAPAPVAASTPAGTSSVDVAAPATAPVKSSTSGSGPAGPLLPIGLATAGLALAAGTVDYQRLLRRPLPA
jgi:hypothetical protein